LRQAVTDRLRQLALDRPGMHLTDLLRQFAYDRFLARVFTARSDGWVLKGATALLARLGGSARHTADIDLYHPGTSLDAAEEALRVATSADIGDFFRFELSPGRRIAEGRATARVQVITYLGATEFARFHIDLVTGLAMTGEPEVAPSLLQIELAGIDRVLYQVYPIADHIADKVCAMLELHSRESGSPQPSTRYRDLVDLALIAHTQVVNATGLARALASESRRRGMVLPNRLSVPASVGWRAGYARSAREAPALVERELSAALATVAMLIDPILDGMATGVWDPDSRSWFS
jgi:hypothetical protein